MDTASIAVRPAVPHTATERRLRALREAHGLALCTRFACEIRGEVDPARLQAALRRVARRHDLLGAADEDGDAPERVGEPVLERLDAAGPEDEAPGARLDRLLELVEGPAEGGGDAEGMRFLLCGAGEAGAVLLGRIPSIRADARSTVRFVREVGAAYGGADGDEPGIALPFRKVAAWLSDAAQDAVAASAREFWRRSLAAVPWDAELPVERTPGAANVFAPASLPWELALPAPAEPDADDERRLTAELAAAAAAWLALTTHRRQVSVGVVFEGRGYDELADAIGPYEKHIPIAASLDPSTTFAQLAAQVEERIGEAADWQEWYDPELGGHPRARGCEVPATALCVHVTRDADGEGDGGFRIARLVSAADCYPVKLACALRPGRTDAEIHYDRHGIAPAAAARIGKHVASLLTLLRTRPEQRVIGSSFLTPGERAAWLGDAPDASPVLPLPHQSFARQAAATPDALAVVAGNLRLSYADLDRLASRLAHRLRGEVQTGPEHAIALRMRTSAEALVAVLAVLRTGSAYVPLDPEWPRDWIDTALRQGRVSAVLTADEPPAGETGGIPHLRVSLDELASAHDLLDTDPAVAVDPDNLAYVLFTSGTTGRPKGVMVTHGGLANYIAWSAGAYGLAQTPGSVCHSPLTFDFTLTTLLAPLVAGGTVRIVPPGSALEGLVDALAELDEVGVIKVTPTSVEPLRQLLEARGVRCRVGTIVIGGEALVAGRSLRDLAERLQATIANEYGPTECVVGSTLYSRRADRLPDGPVPVGRPIANTDVLVLTPAGALAETWTEGEIHIGGHGVARGYWGAPAQTAASFVPNPQARRPGERLYRTGDVGRYLASGDILYLGRRDSQVKVRGYRVELAEVEAALRAHPAVADAVVRVVEREDSHGQLAAFLVPAGDGPLAVDEVRSHLAAHLPQYMVPGTLHVVPRLPVTVHGKLDVRALEEAAAAPPRERTVVAPRTDAERLLLRLWQQVLNRESIGIDDNFFELGGDSILTIQVLARASQAGVRLRPRDMQAHPTIRGLGELAEAAGRAAKPAPAAAMAGEVPLSPIQRRFFEWGLQEPDHVHQSVLLEVPGGLRPEHVRTAVAALVEHHDALRLFFTRAGDGWRQHCAERAPREVVAFVDASTASTSEREALLADAVGQAQRSLTLGEPPLFRAVVFQRGDAEPPLLFLVLHHLVVDHVSWTVLLDDLHAALRQAAAGGPITLPPRTASYREWVEHLAARARRDGLEREKAYWLAERWSRVPPLPAADAGAPNLAGDEDTVSFALEREDTHRLLAESGRAYNTRPLDLLLAAYALAHAGWAGPRTLAVDLESHGRDAVDDGPDVSRTVGWFTSLYPVLLSLTHPADPGRSIQEVKEGLRRVPENGVGYGILRYLVEDEAVRARARLASPQVVFNYLGDVAQAVAPDSPFRWIRHSPAQNRSPRNARPHLLEIGAYQDEGRLHVSITFGGRVHERAEVEALAERFRASLREVAVHCAGLGARRFTPSDFPLAGLDQEALDAVAAAHPELEDVYPLSPTQKGMLFHTLADASAGRAYLIQLCVQLSGRLDEAAFAESWRRVVDRHTALRSAFVWSTVAQPLQVVRGRVPIAFVKEDWTAEAEEPRARLERWLERQRQEGLDLGRAPLHRFALFRIPDGRYFFVWTCHHILLDGWSTSNVLREVLSTYQALAGGTEPSPAPPARPYREYVEWLLVRPAEASSRYWTDALSGVSAGTRLAVSRPHSSAGADARAEEALHLAADDAAAVAALAAGMRVTLNTVVQAAWAFVLSRYAGTDDVVFGVTLSGRPHDLPDVENRVGLFINTVPMRVRIRPSHPVPAFLQAVGAQLQEVLEHGHVPLVDILRAARLGDREELFETILVFENYPMQFELDGLRDQLAFESVWSAEQTHYPLTIAVGARGTEWSLKAIYDPARFEGGTVRQVLRHLGDTLAWMARAQGAPLGRAASAWSR